MAVETVRKEAQESPVQLTPAVRESAEEFSAKKGVSLNQFINAAVEEKLAHLQHE